MGLKKEYCDHCGMGFIVEDWPGKKRLEDHEKQCDENPMPSDFKEDYALTKEELAEFAHDLWMHWSQHIAEEESISESRLDRWGNLWTEYENLSEEMKDKDRDLVDKFL